MGLTAERLAEIRRAHENCDGCSPQLLAEEVATCHRLIARLDCARPFVAFVEDDLPPDEARVLDTVRAGGDEEKAT